MESSYDCFTGECVASPSVCVSYVLIQTKIKTEWSYWNQKYPAAVRDVPTHQASEHRKARVVDHDVFATVTLSETPWDM